MRITFAVSTPLPLSNQNWNQKLIDRAIIDGEREIIAARLNPDLQSEQT